MQEHTQIGMGWAGLGWVGVRTELLRDFLQRVVFLSWVDLQKAVRPSFILSSPDYHVLLLPSSGGAPFLPLPAYLPGSALREQVTHRKTASHWGARRDPSHCPARFLHSSLQVRVFRSSVLLPWYLL